MHSLTPRGAWQGWLPPQSLLALLQLAFSVLLELVVERIWCVFRSESMEIIPIAIHSDRIE